MIYRYQAFAKLKEVLADIYNDLDRAKGVIRDAGLAPARIKFSTRPIDNWDAILEEAEHQSLVGALLDIAISQYPNEKKLQDAQRAYNASMANEQPEMGNHSGSLQSTMNIPPKAYHDFIGRQDKIDEIMGILREPKRKAMIAIFGLGGIGKTALAREVVERCREEESFKDIVWVSFKTELFVGERITQIASPEYSFDELLTDIARQTTPLDTAQMSSGQEPAMDIPSMPPAQRQSAVKNLLNKKRVLIVLDNLETLPDSDNLVANVFEILGKSKLLITSRHEVIHDRVYKIDLGGFSEDEGVIFLREESKERGIEIVASATRSQLVKIHRVTGGAPLAMKLVIGQVSRQPMEIVLDTLQEASFQGQDYDLYRFIYLNSWKILDMNARMVLVDMSVFPPLKGGAVKDVESISQVNGSDFWLAMDWLVKFSLVDKIGRAGAERFALHPLTQYFIRSDITKEWAE